MEEECCPEFNPKKWDKKELVWKNKHFLVESIPTIFHIPFPPMIGKRIKKMWALADRSKNMISKKDEILVLFRDPSAFKSEIYFGVRGKVMGAKNASLSGRFASRVYDGGYNSIPGFMKDMDGYLLKKGKSAKEYYVHYAYCPKCAKKYGNNYLVLFARL